MTKTTFGRTGYEVTRLGFGGAEVGFLPVEKERVGRLLNTLLDLGVNVIDTAAAYAGSEELIGEAVGHRRDQYVLISKCGQAQKEVDAPAWSAKVIGFTVDRALKRLRTDHLDAMLLHSCDLATLKKGEAIGALVEAQKAGKVRWVGYSGDHDAAAWAAARPEIAVIETSISIADQANIERVLPVCRKNNVGVLAKRSIANAAWKDVSEQPGFYQTYAKPYADRLGRMGIRPSDLGFSGAEAWAEIALRFTLAQEGVHTAIIGTTKVENVKANIEAAEKGPLPKEVVMRLREAFDRAEAGSGEIWVGRT